MADTSRSIHLQDPISAHARRDVARLRVEMTVEQALAAIREHGVGERIIYFYVIDSADKLVGVVPTRRLLVARLEQQLSEIMLASAIAIPHTATVLDACEFFVLHKFLAFPVVDDERHLVGVVDVAFFTSEVFDVAEQEESDAVFEALGFRLAAVRDASPWTRFRFRFPWLMATICSGTLCALLTSAFEATLAESLVLAFFLTMVLGLAESVGMQSMTVTIQALRVAQPNMSWYLRELRREAPTALLIGAACGIVVAMIVVAWRGPSMAAVVIGAGVVFSLTIACLFGLSVPAALHAMRLDPKISAGPLTLALTDLLTLLFYFTLAAIVL